MAASLQQSTARDAGGGHAPPADPQEQAAENQKEAAESLEQATRAVQVALDRRSGGAGAP